MAVQTAGWSRQLLRDKSDSQRQRKENISASWGDKIYY